MICDLLQIWFRHIRFSLHFPSLIDWSDCLIICEFILKLLFFNFTILDWFCQTNSSQIIWLSHLLHCKTYPDICIPISKFLLRKMWYFLMILFLNSVFFQLPITWLPSVFVFLENLFRRLCLTNPKVLRP